MGKLPSGYYPVLALYKTASDLYFDTGIAPTNNTNVDVLFASELLLTNDNTYIFGSRKTNSNSSAEQLNLLFGNTSYFGYGSTRTSFTHNDSDAFYFYFSNVGNAMQFNGENVEITEATATAATFTGTRTMYCMGLNNAGNINHGSNPNMKFFYMGITQNGQKVSELYPAMNSVGDVGLYDTIRETFITPSGADLTGVYSKHIYTQSSGHGRAYIRTPHGDYYDLYYKNTNDNIPESDFSFVDMSFVAEADDGYVFSHWSDYNDKIISTDSVLYRFPSTIGTVTPISKMLKANFVKKSDHKQKDRFFLLGLQYGVGYYFQNKGRDYDYYTLIRSFDVKEDGLTKTVSTIVCEDIPSTYQVNMPVAIISNRGKTMWSGIIETINGDTLTCREPLSIFDEDFVFVPNSSYGGRNLTRYALPSAIQRYTENFFTLHTSSTNAFTDTNDCSVRKGECFNVQTSYIQFDNSLSYDKSKNVSITMPLISETSVSNLEDYLMDLFDSTGYGIVGRVQKDHFIESDVGDGKNLMYLDFYYPNRDTVLSVSDNVEFISNVDVKVESQEYTTLEIYNSTGTTCRGVYGMQTDGTITDMVITQEKPVTSFIGYTDCRTAVVLSDDNINTLLVQYLSNSLYNHIITFELDLNNDMYEFDDFTIGRRVKFYVDNKAYDSVVTGKEFTLKENEDTVNSVKITLGKVRKKLTDRINLSKIKK